MHLDGRRIGRGPGRDERASPLGVGSETVTTLLARITTRASQELGLPHATDHVGGFLDLFPSLFLSLLLSLFFGLFLGGGSNVVIADGGISSLVLRVGVEGVHFTRAWFYPEDRPGRDRAVSPTPVLPDSSQRLYRYTVEGDNPPWRPVGVYDDGRKVYIEFSPGIVQGEMPPLFVIGPDGNSEIVNYRTYRNVLIVDRLAGPREIDEADRWGLALFGICGFAFVLMLVHLVSGGWMFARVMSPSKSRYSLAVACGLLW